MRRRAGNYTALHAAWIVSCPPVKDAYRIDEVAGLFRVDPRTVYRWLQRVILTATRRRGIRWIAYSDIDRFL